MRNYLATTLFAGISVALTAGIVAFSSAPVSAAIPTGDTSHAIVRYSDLNLANKAGRAGLDVRIHAAAERVCPTASSIDFAAMQCRAEAVERAHRDLAGRVAMRVAPPKPTAAI